MEPATRLHDFAVKLYDRKDGHGTDWAETAEACFRVAFACLRNVPASDPRGAQIAQQVHSVAYDLIAGNGNSGTPYTAGAKPARPAFTMIEPAPEHGLGRG